MKFTKEEAKEMYHAVLLKRLDLASRVPKSYGITKQFYDRLFSKLSKLKETKKNTTKEKP